MSSNNSDSLTLTAEAALAAGMSYGKYVAQYGVAPADTSDVSELDALADLMAVCPECGVSFYKTHGSQKYCCRECSTRHGCREAARRYRARAAAARDADGGDDD